jgi:hypothetical protein
VPAAAVTPAPIAYIKVVAVKKLVVELESFLVGIGLGARVGSGSSRLWLGAIPNKSSFPFYQGL